MVRSRSQSKTRTPPALTAQKICQNKRSDTRLATDTFGYTEVIRLDNEAKALLQEVLALQPSWNKFSVFLPSPINCTSCSACTGHGDRGTCFFDSAQDCLAEVQRLADLNRNLQIALLEIKNPSAIATNQISWSLLELLPRSRALMWLEQKV